MSRLILLLSVLFFIVAAHAEVSSSSTDKQQATPKFTAPTSTTINIQSLANQALLPANFPIYSNGKTIINHPMPGFAKKTLPTNNDYTQAPGCYLICYSHNNTLSAIYQAAPDIFAYGQVRVPGSYEGRICKPTGYENIDISGDPAFKSLCETKVMTCQNNQCWAGGDTGGWFGLP